MRSSAARKLPPRESPAALDENDPVLAAFLHAPADDRVETEEERAVYDAAVAGPWLSHAEVVAGLDRRRLAEEG